MIKINLYKNYFRIKGNFSHGESMRDQKSKLYRVWDNMKSRCKRRESYVKKNIKVCDDWINSYQNFKTWAIHSGYNEGLQIDREDNNGDYTPDNCRWVTPKVNSNNKSTTSFVYYNGVKYSYRDIEDIFGIKMATFRYRVKKYGWTIERAIRTPTGKYVRNNTIQRSIR